MRRAGPGAAHVTGQARALVVGLVARRIDHDGLVLDGHDGHVDAVGAEHGHRVGAVTDRDVAQDRAGDEVDDEQAPGRGWQRAPSSRTEVFTTTRARVPSSVTATLMGSPGTSIRATCSGRAADVVGSGGHREAPCPEVNHR